MPSYDFEVDIDAVVKAADGTAKAIEIMAEHDVEDFVPTEAMVGHADVWAAVNEFKNRWERGLQDMTADVQEISGRLSQVAASYATYDSDGHDALSEIATNINANNPLADL